MEKIKEFYNEKTDIINILIITIFIALGALIFHGHYNGFFTDKGRELLFPTAMLDGKVLYKDILCIYFPLAFQVNAVLFKFFGINIQTLEFFNAINAILTCSFLYLISKEFLSKSFSLLFSLLTALAATFNGALFNLLMPYSCSFTYGATAYLAALYLLIKYIKNENTKYLPFCYLIAGLALAFKSEFGILLTVLLLTTFLIKPCSLKQNIINIVSYSIFPLISFGILFMQGVTIGDLVASFEFMRKFFTTDSMIYHISRTGAIFRIEDLSMYAQYIPKTIGLYLVSYLLFKVSRKSFFVIIAAAISAYIANFTNVGMNTIILPLTVLAILLYKAKDIYSDKPFFVLIVASLALNIRMFWVLILSTYGFFTAGILILSFIVMLFRYLPEFKFLSKEDLKQFTVYMAAVYFLFFLAFNIWQYQRNDMLLQTSRGDLYLPKKKVDAISYALSYVEQFSTPEQKILVLPEGMTVNFLTKRSLDFKLPMADRLYYDAVGAEKVLESLKKTDYEMIFVIQGFGLTNFGNKPYLYEDGNPVYEYIKENYKLDWETQYYDKPDRSDKNIMKCFVKPY